MKKEYDFTNAEQGKFYRPLEELEIPVYFNRNCAGKQSESAYKAAQKLNEEKTVK